MAISISAPDGSTIQFPDGTSEATITDVMRKNFPPPKAAEQPSTLDRVVASPIGRFAQENIADPLMGAAHLVSRYGFGITDPRMDQPAQAEQQAYQDSLARNRNTPGYQAEISKLQAKSANAPSASSGSFLPSLQSTIAGMVGLAGGLDSSNAMADQASQNQQTYGQAHPIAATAQALIGGLTTVPEGGAKIIPRGPAPTVEELKKASSAAYDQVRSAGLEISPQPLRQMVQKAKADLVSDGFDPRLHPNTAVAMDRLETLANGPKAPNSIPLTQLETERKVAGQAAKSAITNPSDSHMAGVLQDHIDDLVDNIQPQDIISGNPAALQQLPLARQTWKTARKSQMISDAFERAQNASQLTQSGYENALRGQFRQIANNPKKMRAFNQAEQDAIRKVVRGGPIENTLRWIGKLAPRGVVSAGMDVALGHATGAGITPIMLAGEAGRAAATKATLANADRASALVRSGGNPAAIGPQLAPQVARPATALPYGSLSALLDQLSQQQQKQYGLVPAH